MQSFTIEEWILHLERNVYNTPKGRSRCFVLD